MPARPIVEFRDPDGTYVLVRPLDDVRGVVLDGTLHEEGEVLYKDASLSWKRASRDIGGGTLLSPHDLTPGESEEPESPTYDVPDEDEDVFESAHQAVELRCRRDDPREALSWDGPEETAIEDETLRSMEKERGESLTRNARKLRSA